MSAGAPPTIRANKEAARPLIFHEQTRALWQSGSTEKPRRGYSRSVPLARVSCPPERWWIGTRGLIGCWNMASALPVVVRVKRKRELAPVDTIVVEAEESHAAKRRARDAALAAELDAALAGALGDAVDGRQSSIGGGQGSERAPLEGTAVHS